MNKKLKTIENKLHNIWMYTEGELSDYSNSGLIKHLESISDIVNDILEDLNSINKGAKKQCGYCNDEQYICEKCMNSMEKEFYAPTS
jgi:hypothetical protein